MKECAKVYKFFLNCKFFAHFFMLRAMLVCQIDCLNKYNCLKMRGVRILHLDYIFYTHFGYLLDKFVVVIRNNQ